MTDRKPLHAIALLAALAATLLSLPALASAADAPAWRLTLTSNTTNFAPGDISSSAQYTLLAANVGGAPTATDPGPDLELGTEDDVPVPITITDTLPPGLTPTPESGCVFSAPTLTCTYPGPVAPGDHISTRIRVDVEAGLAEGTLLQNQATVSGGGAATALASTTTTVSSTDPAFDFLPGPAGLSAAALLGNGLPAGAAGSHPHTLAIDLGFPTVKPGPTITGVDGGPGQIHTFLPRGMIVDPTATPVRCKEVELEGNVCPDAAAIGTVNVLTSTGSLIFYRSPLYNMVPPPGVAANLAFNAAGSGFYVHILGGLRAGDYALAAANLDIPAQFGNPVMGAHVQLWGDPSAPSHDLTRGACAFASGPVSCPVPPQDTPLLSMPTSCPDQLQVEADAASWGHPAELKTRSAPLTDLLENPVTLSACNALEFDPTLTARPTTSAADSPTGLEASLKIPQTDSLSELATAHLRRAVVTLPEGLVVNPSSANGLAGCSSEQIGIDPTSGIADGDPVSCPPASRIGKVEVDTPLLDHPLPGSVFVASPHDNPFDSLLAIYVVIDDPLSGVLVKLAGHVAADPQSGRLTTSFERNPQLPFSEFRLDFFGGAAAALRTPATCGDYATTSSLTPWSAPESGPPAATTDAWSIDQSPTGGNCPTTPAAQPHSPAFEAGSASLIAGHHSPFVLHLRREDGSQQFSTLSVKPPPGLLAKLAGTATCPETALQAAAAKSGTEEQAAPSCPQASRVGQVTVAAGAGPAPYHATGTAYLTGPYKSAPLSLAIITPATAGPYDLGTVLVRTALRLDPATTEITAAADPIPQILQGIPLDVRSIDVALDKPEFTLNPTNCDPLAVSGELFSSLGTPAPLFSRYQLAECGRLPFKPKLALKLKGATRRATNPRLIATLTARPGEANIAKAQVKLPKAAFLDNSHIKTICTRVQFAAGSCPPGSVYGKATATSPLLDYPLPGTVYLRSSSNPLPDLVVAFRGPDYQPLEVELAGVTDSVKGALRNTFRAVPDVPVSSFRLELFGGKRGLVELSRNLCAHDYRATVRLDAHNGKVYDTEPLVGTSCKKTKKKKPRNG